VPGTRHWASESRPGSSVSLAGQRWGEISFSIYGERGIVDILAWHQSTSSLVVIELKTAIVDVNELIGTFDRKRRLATRIAAERGWIARSVCGWLIVGDSRTNRRRVAEHRTLLTSGLPQDGRSFAPIFRHPERGLESGIGFWPNLPVAGVRREVAARQRVVKRNPSAGGAAHARVSARPVVGDRS
jgi:hypothetical protein